MDALGNVHAGCSSVHELSVFRLVVELCGATFGVHALSVIVSRLCMVLNMIHVCIQNTAAIYDEASIAASSALRTACTLSNQAAHASMSLSKLGSSIHKHGSCPCASVLATELEPLAPMPAPLLLSSAERSTTASPSAAKTRTAPSSASNRWIFGLRHRRRRYNGSSGLR